MRRFFITGASGFIGKHLCRYLLVNGYEVVAYSRKDPQIAGIQWIQGDILQLEHMTDSMVGCDVVIHLAAITPYARIVENPHRAYIVYEKGILNILHAVQRNGIECLLYPSSGKVYGRKNALPYVESEDAFPDILMGKLKLIAEKKIEAYSYTEYKLSRIIIARIFNVYGAHQDNAFLIPKLLSSSLENIVKIGCLQVSRDYIYIDDLLSAFLALLQKAPTGFSVYNIASGVPISIQTIVDTISAVTKKEVFFVVDEKHLRKDERMREYADIHKLLDIGWTPNFNFQEGIVQVQNFDMVKNNV